MYEPLLWLQRDAPAPAPQEFSTFVPPSRSAAAPVAALNPAPSPVSSSQPMIPPPYATPPTPQAFTSPLPAPYLPILPPSPSLPARAQPNPPNSVPLISPSYTPVGGPPSPSLSPRPQFNPPYSAPSVLPAIPPIEAPLGEPTYSPLPAIVLPPTTVLRSPAPLPSPFTAQIPILPQVYKAFRLHPPPTPHPPNPNLQTLAGI